MKTHIILSSDLWPHHVPLNISHLVNLQILSLSHSSSLTLLTPLPSASTPLPPPGLVLPTDLYTEEARFPTSPACTSPDLRGPGKWRLNPTRSGEWEVAVRCPHWPCSQAGLNWPYPCAGAGISCPEALGLDTMGLSVTEEQDPSGTLAVGFPGLSCVNLYCCKALVLVFNKMETLSPASCPSVMVGQLHFTLGLGQLKLIMNSAQVRKAFSYLLDLFFFLSFPYFVSFFLFHYRWLWCIKFIGFHADNNFINWAN